MHSSHFSPVQFIIHLKHERRRNTWIEFVFEDRSDFLKAEIYSHALSRIVTMPGFHAAIFFANCYTEKTWWSSHNRMKTEREGTYVFYNPYLANHFYISFLPCVACTCNAQSFYYLVLYNMSYNKNYSNSIHSRDWYQFVWSLGKTFDYQSAKREMEVIYMYIYIYIYL